MRVIAGAHKGRRLVAPTWAGLRPTSDRLKESVFAILAPVLEGARVLDGFAGSGALGIEALSRGAASVVFVEIVGRAAGLIEPNLAHCRIADGYVMIRAEFTRAMRQLAADRRFDVALLDPPYDLADLDAVKRAPPRPPHAGQAACEAPGASPEPVHDSQFSSRGTLIVRSHPTAI